MTMSATASRTRRWDPPGLVLAGCGWVALTATLLAGSGPIRVVAVFGFVLVCPGWAIVRRLGRHDPLEDFVVGMALSMSLAVSITVVMAVTHWWHPIVALAALALITIAAALVPVSHTAVDELEPEPGDGGDAS